jgi:uncharacterized phage infection (PIP) family protein YhgE
VAGEINFQIDAETRGAEQGLEKVADGFDDAAKSADKLGDEGAKSGEKVEDAAKDAAKAIDRDLTEALKDAGKASKKTGDDIGDDIKRGADEAGDGLDNFKDEANGTAREVAASFDGSAESIAGGFQEVAANALSGFGPLGAAAGIALAAGFGTLFSRIQGDTERAKQAVSDMYDDMLESGADFLSKEFVTDQLNKIYKGAEDAAISIEDLRKLATDSEIPEPLLARALVGDKAAQEEVKSAISARRLEINEALDEATAKGGNLAPVLAPAIQALQDIEDEVAGTAESFAGTQRNAQAARDAINGVIGATTGAASSADDARAKYDGLGRKISEIPTERTITVKVAADTTEAQRQIKRLTDGSYAVTVKGRVTGMRYE